MARHSLIERMGRYLIREVEGTNYNHNVFRMLLGDERMGVKRLTRKKKVASIFGLIFFVYLAIPWCAEADSTFILYPLSNSPIYNEEYLLWMWSSMCNTLRDSESEANVLNW